MDETATAAEEVLTYSSCRPAWCRQSPCCYEYRVSQSDIPRQCQHPVIECNQTAHRASTQYNNSGTGKKSIPDAITECKVPELISVLGSQPTADVSHKPGSRQPLLSARPAVTPAILKRAATNTNTRYRYLLLFHECWGHCRFQPYDCIIIIRFVE